MGMRAFTVIYLLEEGEAERLERITRAYNERGWDYTMEEMFDTIMILGSKYHIDSLFKLHESGCGLISSEEYRRDIRQ